MAKDRKMNSNIPARDLCMTPGYALEPLIAGLGPTWLIDGVIWEPAAGEGILAEAIREAGREAGGALRVVETEISREPEQDFFKFSLAPFGCKTLVTNPPFSIRDRFTEHALQLCPRVALLMPTETVSLGWFHRTVEIHGDPGIIWSSPRIDFKMPFKGWGGAGSQFPCAWFTWGWFKGNRFLRMEHWTKAYRRGFEK